MADEQPSHFDVVIANLEKRIYVYGGHWQSVDMVLALRVSMKSSDTDVCHQSG